MTYQVFVLVLFVGMLAGVPCEKHKSQITVHNKEGKSGVGIYDGSVTTITKHPYLVGLLDERKFRCAAVIVSSNYVLVLGDCVEGMTAEMLTVVAGSSDGITGTGYSINQIILHPNYTRYLDYDFALLQINGTFTWGPTVSNVTLPKNAPVPKTPVIVSGWGDTSSNKEESNGTLLQGKMKVISMTECKTAYNTYSVTFTDRMGCAYNKGKTTCCENDFGDPFMKGKVLYGVFAAGGADMCTSEALPSIYADVYSVVDWIQQFINV